MRVEPMMDIYLFIPTLLLYQLLLVLCQLRKCSSGLLSCICAFVYILIFVFNLLTLLWHNNRLRINIQHCL